MGLERSGIDVRNIRELSKLSVAEIQIENRKTASPIPKGI